jgi:peptidoglycan hydrolase-like protein with peptidoglycan-binding domain
MANLPTIKKGSSGPDVKRMQHLLAAAGFMNESNTANYDGVWGNGTETAKVNFDNAHGLKPSPPTDCGDKSWESLMTGKKW